MRFQDVKAATLEDVLAADRPRSAALVVVGLGTKLSQDSSTGSTFDGQVKRALAQLVAEGKLDRSKPRLIGYARRDWRYEKPGLSAARAADRAARQDAKEAEEAAYKGRVSAALNKAGIAHRFYGDQVLIPRDQAEVLATLLAEAAVNG